MDSISQQHIADARAKYFDKFVGWSLNNQDHDEEYKAKHPNGWYGMTPDEAMQLADKVVAWLYSEPKVD